MRTQPATEPAGEEINLIGCTVEEATRRVDKFLDQAALAGSSQIRIIHGHGTGALRRGLAEFLKTHPAGRSYSGRSRGSRRKGNNPGRIEGIITYGMLARG